MCNNCGVCDIFFLSKEIFVFRRGKYRFLRKSGKIFLFLVKIMKNYCFEYENNFLNLHRSLKGRSMNVLKFIVFMVSMLLLAACSTAEYCNCG